MPRDSAWRTSPTRRSQVSAGARPRRAAALGGHTSPGPPGALLLPPVAELLLFTFRQGSRGAAPPRRAADAPSAAPAGLGVRLRRLIVCTRGSALLPSLSPSALAPLRPLARWLPPGGPGSPGPSGVAAARGQSAERGAHPTPLARANLEKLRPQFAQRHSLSGAFSTPALAPAGAVERRGGRPSPLAPLAAVPRAERAELGLGAGEAAGTPTGALGLPTSAVPGGFGEFTGSVSDLGRDFQTRCLSACPAAVGHLRLRETPSRPAPLWVLRAASYAGSWKLSQLRRVAQRWVRRRVPGPSVPCVPRR